LDDRFLIFFGAVVLAKMVEATVGFGSTIIAIALAAMVFPMDYLLYVVVPLNSVLSSYIVLRYHNWVDRRLLFRTIIPSVGLGMPLGMWLFYLMDTSRLKFGFGVFILAVSIIELARTMRSRDGAVVTTLSGPVGFAWLFAGGIIQGLCASGGPLVVYFAGRRITDKRVFRATLSALWLVLNLVIAAGYLVSGKLSAGTARDFLMLVPAVAIGTVAGEWLHGRLNEKTFKLFVFTVLLITGLLLVLMN
jgi:uncharacterized membrane protein YfcA